MSFQDTIIIGAGIAGISAAYHLQEINIPSQIIEKNNSWGGLCDNFVINGFLFDKFIHLSFSDNDYVRELFNNSSDSYVHIPDPVNYCNGRCLKHPLQNNLYKLPIDEKIKIIKSFIKKDNNRISGFNSYEEWLRNQYGDYFAEKYPMQYTKKYWTVEAKELETKWIGNRMYKSSIEEVLKGAMTINTPNTYYAKEMRYPIKGGYKAFLSKMAESLDIILGDEVVRIDTNNKYILLSSNKKIYYRQLISTIPLPELCKMIINIPDVVIDACKKLKYTSGVLISLGFCKRNIPKNLWMYIYDKKIKTSRIYSPSIKASSNAPCGCSSIQGEVYFSNEELLDLDLEKLLEDEINNYIKMEK
ncbi:MAG: protoporphyrinogen/coproporphyrinogen oxidase, partial [bacterium]